MLNIHIYPSNFSHESRILKEAATLRSRLGFTNIQLVGVADGEMPREQVVDAATTIRRLGPEKGRGAAKVVNHLIWCLNVLRYCLKHRPTHVNCHSLPVLPIGVLVKWLTGARLIYDAHELETETIGSRGLRRIIGRVVERACMGAVDLLVVVSPGVEAWYREHYRVPGTVTVLNAPRYQAPVRGSDALRQTLGIGTDERIVLYQGALTPKRGVEELAAAAPLLQANGYAVVFMGNGPLAAGLKEKVGRDANFHVLAAVDPGILLSYTASADIGLHLIQDTCLNHHLCLPNKLFEYIMAGLPVVASNVPEMRKVVEGARVGVCVDASDPPTILAAVVRADAMRGRDLEGRLDEVARAYCWEVQEERLVGAYRNFILNSGSLRPDSPSVAA